MLPRIHHVDLLRDDLWAVYFYDSEDARFPQIRMVPVTRPTVCPGGELWCAEFGCVPGDNVFTRAEPVLFEGSTKETIEIDWTEAEAWSQFDYACEVCGLDDCDCGPCTCESGCPNCISENI